MTVKTVEQGLPTRYLAALSVIIALVVAILLPATTFAETLKVSSDSGSWTYDGNSHVKHEYTVYYGSETYGVVIAEGADFGTATLSTGDVVTITPDAGAAITHVSETTVDNAFTWTVDNESTYTKGTDTVGKLTIMPRSVTLTSASDSKDDDGMALTNDKVTVGGDGFVDGEGATYEVTGSQEGVGSSPSSFTYRLNDGTQADDYETTMVEGILTVNVRTIPNTGDNSGVLAFALSAVALTALGVFVAYAALRRRES